MGSCLFAVVISVTDRKVFPLNVILQTRLGTSSTVGTTAVVTTAFLNVTDVARWFQLWPLTIGDMS